VTPPLGATWSHIANGCSPTAHGIDGRSPTAQHTKGEDRYQRRGQALLDWLQLNVGLLMPWGCMLPFASLARRPRIDERSRCRVAVRAVSPRSATVCSPLHFDVELRAYSGRIPSCVVP